MDIKHLLQIIFTITVVAVIVFTIIRVMRKDKTKNLIAEGMFLGLAAGAISGYYILNALICAPIGMFLGIAIGRKKAKGK